MGEREVSGVSISCLGKKRDDIGTCSICGSRTVRIYHRQVREDHEGVQYRLLHQDDELVCQPVRVHSRSALHGRLLIQFTALTLPASIRKVIEEKESAASANMPRAAPLFEAFGIEVPVNSEG